MARRPYLTDRHCVSACLSRWQWTIEVYDADGQQGILVPNSMEYDAAREIAAGMGTSIGSSINISTDAGAQIASDVGKGVIRGVSQYVGKKMRTVKITLKAGHRLLLHSPEK